MITKIAMLNGVEHTVLTPMINKVTEDINKKIIKDDNVFINNITQYDNDESEMTNNLYKPELGKSMLEVSYDIEDNEELTLTTSTYKPINKIILLDKDNGTSLRPRYISSDITIKFKYYDKSKIAIKNIKSRLRTYYLNSGYTIIHDLPYSFLYPPSIISLLSNIAELKGMNVFNYIETNATYAIDYAIKRGSEYKVPSFRGIESGIMGSISTEPKDVAISKDDKTYYTLEFEYIINVQRPMALAIQYPILVNNKKLDDIWLPKEEVVITREPSNNKFDIRNIIGKFYREGKNTTDVLYRVPTYDNFVPGFTRFDEDMIKLISLLIEVNPSDDKLLFNIDDLRFVGLPDFILEYMKLNRGDTLFRLGYSLFYINLYEGNYIREKKLYLTDTNDIKTLESLDSSKTYHLLIHVVTDLGLLKFSNNSDNPELLAAKDMCDKMNIKYTINNKAIVSLPDNALVDEK